MPRRSSSGVLAHRDRHVQVARRAAARTGLALPLDRDPLARVDPRRDLDLQGRSSRTRPSPRQSWHGRGDDAALALAARAGGDVHHLAQDRLADPPLLAGAVALRALLRLAARLGAGAFADRASDQGREA